MPYNTGIITVAIIAVIVIIILFILLERLFLKKEISLCYVSVKLYTIPDGASLEGFLEGKYAAQKIKQQGFINAICDPKNSAMPLFNENIKNSSPESGELDLITTQADLYRSFGGVKKFAYSSIAELPLKEEQTKIIHSQIMDMTKCGKRIMLVLDYDSLWSHV